MDSTKSKAFFMPSQKVSYIDCKPEERPSLHSLEIVNVIHSFHLREERLCECSQFWIEKWWIILAQSRKSRHECVFHFAFHVMSLEIPHSYLLLSKIRTAYISEQCSQKVKCINHPENCNTLSVFQLLQLLMITISHL